MSSIANQQIFEPIFEMFGVDVFRDGLVCQVASNFLFRLSVSHVGRMNTQVWLLNSLVRFAGWVKSEPFGSLRKNAERMMFNSIHKIEMPSKMFYLLFISSLCQNRRIAECLACRTGLILCLFQTNWGESEASAKRELEIKIVSAVTWI